MRVELEENTACLLITQLGCAECFHVEGLLNQLVQIMREHLRPEFKCIALDRDLATDLGVV
eukprot:1515679-Rhodomonas_salina.1